MLPPHSLRSLVRLALLLGLGWLASGSRTQAQPQTASGETDPVPTLVQAPLQWFKGNLHTHSLWSDGDDFPEMIADWYRRQGYHFLALSDHNILSQGQRWFDIEAANKRARANVFARYQERFGAAWVETRTEKDKKQVRLKPLGEFRHLLEQPGRFLLIQGEELTDKFEARPIHMNASNVLELIPPQGGGSVVEVMRNNLDAIAEQAGRLGRPILGHLNHPNFGYAITAEELAMVTEERFFEVYNGHPGVNHTGDKQHVGIERMWDIINTLRLGALGVEPVYGLATDDSHHYAGGGDSTSGRGWIQVRARFLTPESIVQAIASGDFYASSGVTLSDVQFDAASKTLEVTVDPQPGAHYTVEFVGTTRDYDRTVQPVLGPDGKPLPVTQRYSDDVGRVLAKVEGTKASYTLKGDELYVRAVITSDQSPSNPSYQGQRARAWTQPVGWQEPLAARRAEAKAKAQADPANPGLHPAPSAPQN